MLSMAHKIVTEGGGQLFVSFTFQPDEAMDDELPGQQKADSERVDGGEAVVEGSAASAGT